MVEAGTTKQRTYAIDNNQLAEVILVELPPELPPWAWASGPGDMAG